jgi:hypothetical protein
MNWVPAQSVEPNWSPPQDREKAYRADLHIQTRRPVALFIAGNDEKADSSALSVLRYREWEVPETSLAAFNPEQVSPPSIEHMNHFIGRDSVVPVPPDDYTALRRSLTDKGVELV